MRGDLFSFIELLAIVGGCSVRSRIIVVPHAGSADWAPQPTEKADYVLVYALKGPGIATRITYQLTLPPTAGVYGIPDDDYIVALGADEGEISLHLVNSDPVNDLNVEVYFARFTSDQLEQLRCIVLGSFPSSAVAS